MAKNFKYGIVASVIAVTIATAGMTTVSSFTFVPEAQAWSIKDSVIEMNGKIAPKKSKSRTYKYKRARTKRMGLHTSIVGGNPVPNIVGGKPVPPNVKCYLVKTVWGMVYLRCIKY